MATTNDSVTMSDAPSDQSPNGHRKAVIRSDEPYPYYPVQEGIRVAEAVQKAGGSSASVNDVMKVLGLSSPSSKAWTYRFSTAREFGLVEKDGRSDDAKLYITDLFRAYAHPTSEAERRVTLMQIVLKPPLYGKLLTRFRGAPKPDATGLANLIWRDHGILETVKEQAAEAFLASIEFAGLVTNGVVNAGPAASAPVISSGVSAVEEPVVEEKAAKPSNDAPPPPPQGMQHVAVPADFIVYPCKIGKGRVIKIPLPPEFTKAEVERLYAFLLTQIDEDEWGAK